MSYLSAPATAMVATYCAICSRDLVDAQSVETGVGPTCRSKYGMPEVLTDEQREAANKLVHFIAVRQGDSDEVRDALTGLDVLGCDVLANRIRERLFGKPVAIDIDVNTGRLIVNSPYNRAAVADMQRVPGRRWDAREKVNTFPNEAFEQLVTLITTHYGNTVVKGPKGSASAGGIPITRAVLGLPEPTAATTKSEPAPDAPTTPIKIVRDLNRERFAIWTPFNRELVETMKATSGRRWDASQKCNTFPLEVENDILVAVHRTFGKIKLVESEGKVSAIRSSGGRRSRRRYVEPEHLDSTRYGYGR
jgi:hypothetical protein